MAKDAKGYGRDAKITHHICEHTDQPLYANGLCWPCYHNDYEKRKYDETRDLRQPDHWRERNLWTCFKLTVEEYEDILNKQNGVCKICERPPKNKRLAVDHNHSTGKRRGLLCGPCNTALSHVEHESNFSQKALVYLEEFKD